MAQRVEKVAQRRVEERSEKMKSARKTRFDLRSNPFFSRPTDNITKDFVRLQHEQQQQMKYPPQKVLITSPTDTMKSPEINHEQTLPVTTSPLSTNTDAKSKLSNPKIDHKTKQLNDSTDDNESGSAIARIIENNQHISPTSYQISSATTKRSSIKSETNRDTTTIDAALIRSIKTLKMIFPSTHKTTYRHLFLLDKIAYIYIQFVIILGHKTMTSGQFRSFAKYVSNLSFSLMIDFNFALF